MSRSTLSQLRRLMYLGQRDIGDYQALSRGPDVYVKRIVRRSLVRELFRLLR
ncbi:MAG: hypothetical protein NVS3B26_30440 [Mycobacteriales bacterium]